MTHGVTFLLSLLCWEIIVNDPNHQTIDCQGVLTTLHWANEQTSRRGKRMLNSSSDKNDRTYRSGKGGRGPAIKPSYI